MNDDPFFGSRSDGEFRGSVAVSAFYMIYE